VKRFLIGAVAACLALPAAAQSVSKTSAGSAVSAGQVLRAGTTNLAGLNVVSGASAGYVMLFDAAAVPADGAVVPLRCMPIAANTGLDLNFRGSPLRFDAGAVIVFSTTGCFTKTGSATAFLAGDVQ
jgi:hypothetical protein